MDRLPGRLDTVGAAGSLVGPGCLGGRLGICSVGGLDSRAYWSSFLVTVAGFALQGIFSISNLASQRTILTLVYLLIIT